jgi:small subunit ribosomal protein S1
VKVGEKLEVKVLELDVENRRLALGHRQLEDNPWDTFETMFYGGSIHKGTIISKTDKGAQIELPYGVEGFAVAKNIVKQDGTAAEAGEALDFRVLEFNKEERRIVLSHTAVYTVATPGTEAKTAKKGGKKGADEADATPVVINNSPSSNSLGEDGILAALKSKMESGN